MLAKISNVTIFTEDNVLVNGELYIQDGMIAAIGKNLGKIVEQNWDGQGLTLIPGFIDLHVHGGAGFDFMDHTMEAVEAICQFHASHGTTALLATTMTAPRNELEEVLSFYREVSKSEGAEILGIHLEGPFINPHYQGAQNGKWIVPASISYLNELWQKAGNDLIRFITLAPELVEDRGIFQWLQDKGVCISIGHSDLDYHGGCHCLRNGINHATHLGNAMRAFHHRNIGIMGLVMENPELTFDFIADGIHISPELIRLLIRVCSPEQVMLITDAMRAAGLKDGIYDLGGQEVIVNNGEARLRSGVLAGSLLTLDVALANVLRYTGLGLKEVIPFLTLNQAKKLGIDDRKGSIRTGKDADLVLLGANNEVVATWVRGKMVYGMERLV